MFTGIIRTLGTVKQNGGGKLRLAAKLGRVQLGASVAVNGCCLTVARRKGRNLEFEMSRETLDRTNLGELKAGARVNVEPALRSSDELGGHWVSGHVDARAKVLKFEGQPGGFVRLRVSLPKDLAPLVAVKGSVAVDGTSLTVTGVSGQWFETVLVPHTLSHTTLGSRRAGDPVNIEADMLARYVHRALEAAGR